ncbi:hypothetical protein AVEN_33822-1 [Araneus ventricosus]|uniref:Uncharacterized protein n=1 Tax=Araneus ventricosus TaxID=182803 RepID=A0A4Y2NSG9_ARAVE|nr:hypothetical protein AVEN_33822-1 [Araneus ventricosus]
MTEAGGLLYPRSRDGKYKRPPASVISSFRYDQPTCKHLQSFYDKPSLFNSRCYIKPQRHFVTIANIYKNRRIVQTRCCSPNVVEHFPPILEN